MRPALLALALLLTPAAAFSQVQINIDRGGVSIGVNVASYPTLRRIPNYPVYYAPGIRGANYFFYDGLYWVFEDGEWHSSDWYNGPWHRVDRFDVPVSLLRVPVRYYRSPPTYFRGYRADAPPRWNEQWGSSWAERRGGWERGSLPAPAPLPLYQRDFPVSRYPTLDDQAVILTERYRYQPREVVAQRVYEERRNVAKQHKNKEPKEKKDKKEKKEKKEKKDKKD